MWVGGCRHLSDVVRYAAMVGVMANQFDAHKLRMIDVIHAPPPCVSVS